MQWVRHRNQTAGYGIHMELSGSILRELPLLREARHHAPHSLLGPRRTGNGMEVRVWLPQARQAWLEDLDHALTPVAEGGLFLWKGDGKLSGESGYLVRWRDAAGNDHISHDPYAFAPDIPIEELEHFSAGRHYRAWQFLGPHPLRRNRVAGTRFAVWAPNAERVSVVGDFNQWDGRRHPMTCRGESGVWELFIPDVNPGALYKYEIRNAATGDIMLRADPCARAFEPPPQPASVVTAPSAWQWGDEQWMSNRPDWQREPVSIYELHPASWWRHPDGRIPDWNELADRLLEWLPRTGFTHVQLMPVTEHPFDGSWGYQSTGYFAATHRHGSADDLRAFVDRLHRHGYGVYADWVPGHFPRDDQALARFDGTMLYEHHDARLGEHPDWGTLIFNYGRNEVRSFLISSALYWLEEFHLDGLRVDAVASMLYLDYGREGREWLPNRYGGNENLDAISFLQEMNTVTHAECPGTVTMAEESTAWPGVSRPVWLGGLGFSMKWNMGWMNDTLTYMSKDPVHRSFDHHDITFPLYYAFDENFILPLSHDEVVHGKRSMLEKMPGDRWQKFANLRALYTWQFTCPGKKLLFMGSEFAVPREWSHENALDWGLLEHAEHGGVLALVADLNRLYREQPALHQHDFDHQGFQWIDCHDAEQSVLSYLRFGGDRHLVIVLNLTPVPRDDYRIGVPSPGPYRELFNSDSRFYGGSDYGNGAILHTREEQWMGRPWSLTLSLPPLGGLVLAPEKP